MNYPFFSDLLVLISLCVLLVIAISIGAYWYSHYSKHAKSLSKRLGDIVNIRSETEEPLLKNGGGDNAEQHADFETPAITAQINEIIRLMILRAGLETNVSKVLSIALILSLGSLLLLNLFTALGVLANTLVSLIIATTPFLYIKHKEQKRRIKIEKQLPEALDFICRSLRAGHGLSVSFGMVGDELPNPIAKEFKDVFEEINFGLPFNEAMSNFAVRTNSPDINFLVVGLLIQREAGGNLIELLENLSKTIRDRMILAGKVRILAAEGKYSGILLSALPFIIGSILSAINPQYMSTLWATPTGQQLVITSLFMIVVGALWMWNITRIKV